MNHDPPSDPPGDPPRPPHGPHDGPPGPHLNGHNREGGLADEPPQEEEIAPLPPAPAPVAELCAACMRFVASKYKVALDGTPDTLSLVDQYVREAREAHRERPETIDLVAPAVGAYLGEVMRQAFGAEWYSEGATEGWRLYFHNVFLTFNPIGMGREAIAMEEAEGWHAHLGLDPAEREAIDERLAAMPEVDEEEYYLPSTRFDVVTVVVETLRARAEESGTGDVKFTRDDYD
ncbi:MAG: hypothetical protein JST00_37885 [Deltaproteobacteria bacterium]|nr:hypothetical protein [Deltaproteobacteria bacterium]